MTKEEYEAQQPLGSQKLEFVSYTVRAYVDEHGSLVVKAHRVNALGHEELPLAYLMGTNYLTMDAKR